MTDHANDIADHARRIAALFTHRLLDAAAEHGFPARRVRTRMGLDDEASAPVFLPDGIHLALWGEIMRTLRTPAFPILYAEHVGIDDYGLIGLACKTEKTLGAALELLFEHLPAYTDAVVVDPPEDGRIVVRRHGDGGLGHRAATEATVAELVKAFRVLTGVHLVPRSVSFSHAPPRAVTAHSTFFGCRVAFGRATNEIRLEPGSSRRPLVKADAAVAAHLRRELRRMAKTAGVRASIASRTRHAVLTLLPRAPRIVPVARMLGTSERSLSRALASEGTTFGEIVANARREMADLLLRSGARTVAEVAYATGYEDAAAFSRAYRAWTRLPPSAARNRTRR